MPSISLEPLFSIELIAAIAVLLLAGSYLSLRNVYAQLSTQTALSVMILRGLGALILIGLLLRPYASEDVVDKSAMQIGVVTDVSGSMLTPLHGDAVNGEQTQAQFSKQAQSFNQAQSSKKVRRIDISQTALNIDNEDSWINQLRESYPSSLYSVASNLRTLTSAHWEEAYKNQDSALAQGLITLLESQRESNNALAGVVLMSDGINNSASTTWADAIQAYQQEGIPVSVIGIGDKPRKEALRLAFTQREQQALVDEEVGLNVQIQNNRNQSRDLTISLWREADNSQIPAQLVQTRTLHVEANTQLDMDFSITPEQPGISVYTAKLEAADTHGSAEPLSDKMLLSVNQPEVLRVLYMADSPQQHYRFLKHSLLKNKRFELQSLIRIGKPVSQDGQRQDKPPKINASKTETSQALFYTDGGTLTPVYPKHAQFWRDYEVILLDSMSFSALSPTVLEGLRDFVSQRGGGLFVFGPLPEDVPSELTALLPLNITQSAVLRSKLALALQADRVFADSEALQEFDVYLDKATVFHEAKDDKLSARTLILSKAQEQPVLLAQAYGAGKSAYWGSDSQWLWAMQSHQGFLAHDGFWHSLVEWLASNLNERIQLVNKSASFAAEHAIDFSVNVLGADFSPATNAVVDAVLSLPDGSTQKLELFPRAEILGQYQTHFTPSQTGSYDISFQALLPNEAPLLKKSFFAVHYSQQENTDTLFREDALRKLARLTGGQYYHYNELEDAHDFPLRDKLPLIQNKHYFFEQAWFLLLIICLFGSEWIIRRQRGLR